jgi:threonylcarbamoyladenosine tRNA methylthiotransferase MtaB
LNQYETEALQHRFGKGGFHVVPFGEVADVYVVNTCTVTGSGDADSRRAVRRAVRFGPEATVVATGCYAQRRPDDLREAGAGLVVGNDQKADLVDTVHRHLSDAATVAAFDPSKRPGATRFLEIHGAPSLGRTRGALKIQDGCDEHCTYCIIPSVRGGSVSRPTGEVLEQARRMVVAGYQEVALTGVHSGSYGCDLDGGESLLSLLQSLEGVDGLSRIRLNSVEPGFVSDALIRHAADSSKLCRHFHIPMQSGDDRILRRMGRGYTAANTLGGWRPLPILFQTAPSGLTSLWAFQVRDPNISAILSS